MSGDDEARKPRKKKSAKNRATTKGPARNEGRRLAEPVAAAASLDPLSHQRALALSATVTIVGLALVGTHQSTPGMIAVLGGLLGFIAAIHRFGRLGPPGPKLPKPARPRRDA